MNTRTLGAARLEVSALGLGCMGMSQDYGPADADECLATLHRALDLGVTLIDTSMSYGAGDNERLVGRALGSRRHEFVLATKFGIHRDQPGDPARLDARPERVRTFCEASLLRLGTDHIDLYYLHRVDPDVPVEETIGAMGELVTAGKVRHLGLSEMSCQEVERAAATHPITALQYEWSLWWREVEDDVVPLARALGIGLVPFSPLGRGFLTGTLRPEALSADDDRRPDQRFSGSHLTRNRSLLTELSAVAERHGVTLAQLALAWSLAQGDDVVPIPGTTKRARLEENVASVDVTLSEEDLAELEAVVPRSAWSGDRHSFAVPRTRRRAAATAGTPAAVS